MNELVSIIMPSYNTAAFIRDAIQSVINQTYENWELIIVDDSSTDNTTEILSGITDQRIRVFINESNCGAAVCRNIALSEAKGRWIAFLDSDDLWMSEKLERQISFMTGNGYSFSYTSYEEMDTMGNRTGIRVSGPKRITRTGMYNYCWPGCLTVMFEASNIGKIQVASINKNNDYAMWLKICRKVDCYLLDECLGLYRKGRVGSISTHNIITMIGWHYKLFRDAENMGIISSAMNTGRNLVFGLIKKTYYVKKVAGKNL